MDSDLDAVRGQIPTIPGPWGEPPAVDDVKAVTANALAVQGAGMALHLLASGAALRYLVEHRSVVAEDRFSPLAGAALGLFGADVVSGLLHWAFDTWFDETVEPVKRMVYMVREHHLRPARVLQYRLRDEAGILAWFALALAAPLYASAMRQGKATPARYAKVITAVTMANGVVLMLEFHKMGHRARRGRLPRVLQRARLLLSPEVHLKHHAGTHDTDYCLITGIADRTLGRAGMFRLLEAVITRLTGAEPRADDRQWSLRYGRPA